MTEKMEESFEELFNQSVKDVKIGKTVTGKVIQINSKNEIIVDLGYKADGIIPKTEYSFKEEDNPNQEFKVGDTITADVLKMNDGLGNVLLSYKKAKVRNSKKEFEEKINKEEIFEETITGISDKGLITNYQGIRIFIPMSLSGIGRNEDIEEYKGKLVKFKITEYDEKNKRVIGSVKILKEAKREEALKEFWESAEIGKQYEGEVTSLSSYGAFIEIGVVQGLLHVSEMSWGRNISPEEILQVGQKVKVRAVEVDKENRRLKLTYEEKGPDPWNEIDKKYAISDVVEVKVVKFMPFGAFVELEAGVEGLVHISQISEKKITKPEEELAIGQKVNAKIIDLDSQTRKIELSIRELVGTSKEFIEEIKE